MVARMCGRAERDRFMRRILVGAIFEISHLWVCDGGENVHDQFHLQFNEDTEMKHATGLFPTFPFNVYSCAEVSNRSVRPTGFLGQ